MSNPVVQTHYPLQTHNTFGIEAYAEHFVEVHTVAALKKALQLPIRPVMILGGGSNLLLTQNIRGLLIRNQIKGIEVVKEWKTRVWVSAGGGESWHQFVCWCIENDYGGVENLSLIPGTVGAAPIQNIGAYGVELKDVFLKLEAIHLETGRLKVFSLRACRFGYRDSIFKEALKGQYCITRVYFSLTKKHKPYTSYGDILSQLREKGIEKPGIRDISNAVIAIRSSKLPDPAVLGNSGSFFKNPEIEESLFKQLQEKYPEMPHYDLPNGMVKIPAAWLIEQCGWKGKRVGNTGSHARQALVLVNYGGASGLEIKNLAGEIIDSVRQGFGITLSPEVNII